MKVKNFLKEQNWCKYAEGINSYGKVTHARDRDCIKWCLSGAISKCYRSNPKKMYHVVKVVNSILRSFYNCQSIIEFNDDEKKTFADIQELLMIADV